MLFTTNHLIMKNILTVLFIISSFICNAQLPGNSLVLKNDGEFVEVPDPLSNIPSTDMTLEAWVYYCCTNGNAFSEILSKGWCATSHSIQFDIVDGKLSFSKFHASLCTNSYGYYKTINKVIPYNTWTHVSAVITNGLDITLLVNGQVVPITLVEGVVASGVQFSNQPLRIGAYMGFNTNFVSLKGQLDEVRIWHTARTPAQIQSTMNTTLNGNEAGLFCYYKFDETSTGAGQTVLNSATATGATYNGTTVGTATNPYFISNTSPVACYSGVATGACANLPDHKPGSGNAIATNGIDNFIQIPHSSDINFSTNQDFTIDMWVKIPSTNQVDLSAITNTIIEKWGTPFSSTPYIIQYANNTSPNFGKLEFARKDGPANLNYSFVASSSSFNDDKYHHVVFQKIGSELRIYKDGILDSTATDSSSGITENNSPIFIGKRDNPNCKFNGTIDEIRIWNTALTQSQIRERMCKKITSSDLLYSNLVAYYNFDESSSNLAIDGSMYNNNGTLINSPTRLTSGAAIGNESAYNYVTTGLPSANLTFNAQDNVVVNYTSGIFTGEGGTHVYVVNEKPNTEIGINGVGTNNRYFGVFNANINSPSYNAVYNYAGNPFVDTSNESSLGLFNRNDNAGTSWANSNSVLNTTTNTLTKTSQNASSEFMLGLDTNLLNQNIPITSGNSLVLTNDYQYIQVPDSSSAIPSNDMTIEAWVYYCCTNGTNTENAIVTKGWCYNAWSFWFHVGVDQKLIFGKFGSNFCGPSSVYGQYATPNYVVPFNSWTHVAVVLSGGNNVTFYVNGQLVPSSLSSGTSFIGMQSSSEPLRIGAYIPGSLAYTSTPKGQLDEIRIWQTARTQSEIQASMNNTLIGNETGLFCYYKFDETSVGSGNLVLNSATSTGTTYNGTTVGTTTNPYFVSNASGPVGCYSGPPSGYCVGINPNNSVVNLKLFIEGYYTGSQTMTPVMLNEGFSGLPLASIDDVDDIKVELRNANSPYDTVATTITRLKINGTALCTFPALSGNYYIVIKHRNALQTWSKNPVNISSYPTTYNFSNAASTAYGDNLKEVEPGVWTLYSGDISQDENVDLFDLSFLDADLTSFTFGYSASDINGDGNVDLMDVPNIESNINNFVFSVHP